jgi:hypothetical protein
MYVCMYVCMYVLTVGGGVEKWPIKGNLTLDLYSNMHTLSHQLVVHGNWGGECISPR